MIDQGIWAGQAIMACWYHVDQKNVGEVTGQAIW